MPPAELLPLHLGATVYTMRTEPEERSVTVVTFTEIRNTEERETGEKDHNFSLGRVVPMDISRRQEEIQI